MEAKMVERRSLGESLIEDEAYRVLKDLSEEELRPTLMPDGGLGTSGVEFSSNERKIVRKMLNPNHE